MSHIAMRSGPSLLRGAATKPEERSTVSGRPFASVEVHADPRSVLDDWRALFEAAPVSPYQSPDWLLPWIDTIGPTTGLSPMIVVARDAEGRAVALLPLGVRRRTPLAVACFLGAKDSNFNMGLFRPGLGWTGTAVRDLLGEAAGRARVDLFALRNQPHDWGGVPNPLSALAHQPSPSFAYRTTLLRDPEAFLRARLSRDSRKKLRQKANRLRGLGAVSLVEARRPAEVSDLIEALLTQRTARNAAAGLGGDDREALRAFLDRTAGAAVSLYGLRCGDRIVATLAGTHRAGRFSGMLTSFAADPETARASPGELLLCEVMRRHCAAGDAVFDLGIGEARYKESYCPEVQPLFDSFVAITPRGSFFAGMEAARLRLKRAIKQSPWAWTLAQRVRRLRVPRG